MSSRRKKHIADLIAKFETATRTGAVALTDGCDSCHKSSKLPSRHALDGPSKELVLPSRKTSDGVTQAVEKHGHAHNPVGEDVISGGSISPENHLMDVYSALINNQEHTQQHCTHLVKSAEKREFAGTKTCAIRPTAPGVSNQRCILKEASAEAPKEYINCQNACVFTLKRLSADVFCPGKPSDTLNCPSPVCAGVENAGLVIEGPGFVLNEPNNVYADRQETHEDPRLQTPDTSSPLDYLAIPRSADARGLLSSNGKARRVSFDPVPRIYEIMQEDSLSDSLSDG